MAEIERGITQAPESSSSSLSPLPVTPRPPTATDWDKAYYYSSRTNELQKTNPMDHIFKTESGAQGGFQQRESSGMSLSPPQSTPAIHGYNLPGNKPYHYSNPANELRDAAVSRGVLSTESSSMAVTDGGFSSGKSQPPPPYTPASLGNDQRGANHGFNKPEDRYGHPSAGYHQPVYGYSEQGISSVQTNINITSSSGGILARERYKPPKTSIGFIVSIFVTLLCGYSCGILAVVFNRQAKNHVLTGQIRKAHTSHDIMWVMVFFSLVSGIAFWVYIGKNYMYLL